jgi:hypothetical protein
MRKFNLLIALAVLFISFNSFAQNKIGFKYQTIIRDNSNNILDNKPVAFRMSMLKGSTTGIPVYRETFNASTNSNGLVTLEIGNGTAIFGNFDAVLWYDDNYFLKVEFDPNGGTNFQLMGVSQLLAVPYSYVSLWTQKAVNDLDTSPVNEIQTLSLKGQNLSISQGNTINLPLGDTSNTNEIQMLSFSNDTLHLSNGGFVYLGKFNNSAALNTLKSKMITDSLYLKSLIDTNTAHINVEKTDRVNGDLTLNTTIANEVTQRTNSIALITNNFSILKIKQITDSTILQNNINTVTTNLANEVTDRQTADNGIRTKILADSSYLKYRIDSSLTKIANEISARGVSEGSIYNKVKSDSTYLKGLIDNNTTAISNNNAAISNNTITTNNNTTAISNITSVVSNNILAISNNTTAINNNTTAISNNTTAINTEIADRQTATTGLLTKVKADSTYLKGQIDNILSPINSEISNRQTADNAINTRIIADSTLFKGLIDLNSVSINNEITARQIADNGTYTKIATDSTYLKGLINLNSTSINNEITARQTADNSTYTKIVADSTYLKGLINTNTNDISTLNTNLTTNYYTKANVQTSGNALIHWDNLTNKPTTLTGYGITDATPSSHIGSNGTSHDTANMTTAGFMSRHDKIKLTAVTGTNTGDQTITLTGDVTGTGTGSFVTTISNNAVTNAKIASNSVDGTKIQLGSDANGDMIYYNGTDWVRLPAGTNGQILTLNAGVPTWVTKHYLGESFGGGIVFYVDATGQHGLISTASDISSAAWSNVNTLAIGVSAMSLTDGNSNSNAIVNQAGHTNSAAKICLDYSNTVGVDTYSDWYLPALYQLNMLYNQAYVVGLFTNGNAYWSSTEVSATNAYRHTFITSTQASTAKTAASVIRCIRDF